jgi:hypothetical protein
VVFRKGLILVPLKYRSAAPSDFHISLDTPDGTVFLSFRSSDFPENKGELKTLTLFLIC